MIIRIKMLRKIVVAALLGATAFAAPAVDLDAMTDKQIIDHVDRLLRGDSSRGKMSMAVKTKRWQRSMSLEIWSKGTEYSLIRVLAPRKEKGTATLKIEKDVWNYLPKIDRTIRVPSSMMMASWMGSHFTNDDLVKESRLVRDYVIKRTFNGDRNGRRELEFSLTPTADAAVVWGRIDFVIDESELLPVEARYYDEDGELKRTMTYDQITTFGDRRIPARMTMIPADKPDESTIVLYSDLEFDVEVPDSTFSLQRLRRQR